MGTTTTAAPSAPSVKELFASRDEKIAQFTAETQTAEEATARASEASKKADKEKATKEAQSANARKANRSREIGELELELALQGAEFECWVKPTAPRSSRSRAVQISPEQIEADVAKLAKVLANDPRETVKERADQRITALLKQAEKRGHKVMDPRQNGHKG